MSTQASSIRAVGLSKWFGKVTALSNVSLHLDPGVWGLLGPNGSGKTTFLSLVAGLASPSIGEIRVCGEAPFNNPGVLGRIGFCPEADALYDELTALEMVSSLARISGYGKEEARARAVASLEAFGLGKAMDRKVGGYSRGMRQRVKLAQSVLHDPDVLLLDEPLTGTDPTSRAVILEQIKKRADAGAVVLFSTHVLHEVEALTENLLLIARGQVVAQGTVFDIRGMLEEHPLHVRVECKEPRALGQAMLEDVGIVGLEVDATAIELHTKSPDATYTKLQRLLVERDFGVTSMTSPDATIEALFNYLVERGSQGAGTGADRAVGRGSAQVPKKAAKPDTKAEAKA